MNMRNLLIRFWLVAGAMSITFSAQAQRRIKYKDLYPLLQQQQWDQAEPFLRQYLKQDPDFANAHLQMGLMFDHKARQVDVLQEKEQMEVYVDSAILYYRNALAMIDDRELRRRDEYYLSYNRRDLRTGKFEIKLSDVQLDLETKIGSLEDRVERVEELNVLIEELDEEYAATLALYQALVEDFETQNRLHLMADAATLDRIEALLGKYDTTLLLHQRYAKNLNAIGGDTYPTELRVLEIEQFGRDGLSGTEFTQEDAAVWDYEGWASAAKRTIEEEITPMRKELVTYDAQFSVVYGDFLQGLDIRGSLDPNKPLMEKLDRLDPGGLAQRLFDYKLKELEYYQVERDLTDPAEQDTALVVAELSRTESVHETLTEMESAFEELRAINLQEAAKSYPTLLSSRYNGVSGFQDFLKNRESFLHQEREQIDRYLREWRKRDAEGIWAPDTVIVLAKDSLRGDSLTPGAHTLALEQFKEENYWVGGMFFNPGNTLTGYAAHFGPERLAKWRHQFPLENVPAVDSLVALASSVIWKDENVQYVVFYNQRPVENAFPGMVARIDDGQVSWSTPVSLARPVKEVRYRQYEEDIKFYLEGPEGQEANSFLLVSNTGEVMLPEDLNTGDSGGE